MNILPKKRWHVRTKDNIARVRKDEAAAAEAEKERLSKVKLAEREARIDLLRARANSSRVSYLEPNDMERPKPEDFRHINLFEDLDHHVTKVNEEYLKEQKEEREKYEKQIGYLKYLGQDTNEALKIKSWYEKPPDRSAARFEKTDEKSLKSKFLQDPLNLINTHLGRKPEDEPKFPKVPAYTPVLNIPPAANASIPIKKAKEKKAKKEKRHKHEKKSDRHKHKKEKKHKKHKKKKHTEILEENEEEKRAKLAKLRIERLKREADEKRREKELLAVIRGEEPKKPEERNDEPEKPRVKQKYNSQFNPELAKQNYDLY